MEFTEGQINSFIAAWQKEFGEKLTHGEAVHHASRVMKFALLATKRPPSEQKKRSRGKEV